MESLQFVISSKMKKIGHICRELDSSEASKTQTTMKAAKDKKLNEAVAMWFMQKRSEGVPISGPILMAKAL